MRTFVRTFALQSNNFVGKEVFVSKARVTLKEVASTAGVSYQTVSKVLNNQIQVSKETQERIYEAARILGYRPNYTARSLRSQRSFTLGYSWPPAPPDQVNPILDQFLQSMFQASEERGYYLLSFPYHTDERKRLAAYSDLIDTGRVDGFVLSSIEYNDPRVLFLLEKKFPFVAFGRSNPDLDFPWIDVDGARGIEMAVQHLIERGHRRIAALAWPEDSRVGNNRMEGYFSALRAAGIDANPAWVRRGEGIYSFGFSATLELLQLPEEVRPTALVTLNDTMATGAIWAAKEAGRRVGQDFAIAGFDDAPMAQYLDPPLTTMRQPVWEVGQRIIPLLLDYIDSGELPARHSVMVAPELIVRKSTGG
jgi:DNA-binding LacI/PurR family transcriptional regulator